MITLDFSPVAFTIGGFGIRWYGIMLALGVIVVVLWTMRQVKKSDGRVTYDNILNAALVGIPSGIIFSRLLHVVDQWDFYRQNPNLIVGGDGLTIYGGVLGAALGIWVYSKFSKVSFGHMAEMIAPGIVLGQAIGRVGCLLNGCCYGVETKLPWGIVYSSPLSFGPIGIEVHPTQVYEIIFLLLLFVVLLLLKGRFQPTGSLFVIYLGLYSLWRFSIGFLRDGTVFMFDFQQAQVIGIAVIAVTIYWMALRARWTGKITTSEEIVAPAVEDPPKKDTT